MNDTTTDINVTVDPNAYLEPKINSSWPAVIAVIVIVIIIIYLCISKNFFKWAV